MKSDLRMKCFGGDLTKAAVAIVGFSRYKSYFVIDIQQLITRLILKNKIFNEIV